MPAEMRPRMIPPRTWTLAEIAKMIGYNSKGLLFQEVKAKRLKVRRNPAKKLYPNTRFIVAHEDLCRWLLASGFPLEDFRYMLNPGNALLGVGLTSQQIKAMSYFNLIPCNTMFRLGQLTRERHSWAIIVNIAVTGYAAAVGMARDYKKEMGRPYLIAITSQTRESGTPGRAADHFDMILPDPCEPAKLASVIKKLKKYGDRSGS